jgi:cob(I)alamin adenosyltransferase
MRAVGQGMRVTMIQFIKGSWKTGEQSAAKLLGERFELHTLGLGFTRRHPGYSKEKNQAAAGRALAAAREKLASGAYDLVILDEINYAIDYDLVPLAEVLDLIAAKPPAVHLVLTGRQARPELIERADLVTEMHAVKHPFSHGARARRGIEF